MHSQPAERIECLQSEAYEEVFIVAQFLLDPNLHENVLQITRLKEDNLEIQKTLEALAGEKAVLQAQVSILGFYAALPYLHCQLPACVRADSICACIQQTI